MGPLLFAAGIHEVISKVAAEYPGAWSIWYLDDGTIVVDLTTLNTVAGRLNAATSTEPFPLLKLMRYHPKTESEGVRLLGIPIGGKRYTQDFVDSIANNVGDFCEAISCLRCSQIGAALLRYYSGVCKVVHVLRCFSPRSPWKLPAAN